MAYLQFLRQCTPIGNRRWKLLISLTWLCCLTSGTSAQQAIPAGSQISIEYSVEERSPSATVIGILTNEYPNLKNFRVKNGNPRKMFALDSTSGRITLQTSGVLDAEFGSVHRMTVMADVNAPRNDAFLEEFAALLMEDGVSRQQLIQLTSEQQAISVTIRFMHTLVSAPTAKEAFTGNGTPRVTEPTQPDTVTSDDSPGVAATPDSAPHLKSPDTIRASLESPLQSESVPSDIPTVSDTSTDEPTLIESSSFAELAADAMPVPVAEGPVGAFPETGSSEKPDSTVPDRSVAGPATENLPSVRSSQDDVHLADALLAPTSDAVQVSTASDTQELLLAATSADPEPSHLYAAPFILLIVLLFTTGSIAIFFRLAAIARKPLLRRKKVDVAAEKLETKTLKTATVDRSMATVHAATAVEATIADSGCIQTSDRARVSGAVSQPGDENASARKSSLDPESLFSDEFQSSPGYNRPQPESAVLRQVQASVADHKSMIEKLTEDLSAIGHRVDTAVGVPQLEPVLTARSDSKCYTDDGTLSDRDLSRTPLTVSKRFDAHGSNDLREGLTQARSGIARTLEKSDWPTVAPKSGCGTSDHPPEVASPEPVEDLRTELRDLFDMQGSLVSSTTSRSHRAAEPGTADLDPAADKHSEADHQDSITRYLSHLLERKQEESAVESLCADRGKSGNKSDAADRRRSQAAVPERSPVKSYLESYLKDHGGGLQVGQLESGMPSATFPVGPVAAIHAAQLIERTPADMSSMREHMTSFRSVAKQAVEQALASHSLRQAQGTLVFRKILLFALLIMTLLVITANMVHAIHLYPLNWLMVLVVALCFAELCLRMQAIRRRQREVISQVKARSDARPG